MSTVATNRGSAPAPEAHQRAARALIEELGEVKAAKQLGINRSTLLRLSLGRGLHAGTLALLREKLGRAAS